MKNELTIAGKIMIATATERKAASKALEAVADKLEASIPTITDDEFAKELLTGKIADIRFLARTILIA